MRSTLEDKIQFLLNIKYKEKGIWEKEIDSIWNMKKKKSKQLGKRYLDNSERKATL